MKISSIISLLLLMTLVACGGSTKNNAEEQTIEKAKLNETLTNNAGNIDLIKSAYDIFVFAIDADIDDIHHPEKYFTDQALKKLQEDYTFDCEDDPCYAFYALRTEAQDSKPGSNEESIICKIEPVDDRWYIVSYLDMGWPGKTRIKLANGKIDDYERQVER